MQIPRWQNLLSIKNSILPAVFSQTQIASIHSTTTVCEKWKNKWKYDIPRGQQPSKTYARYAVRQKRADTKKALKNLLFNSGGSKFTFQDEKAWNIGGENGWAADQKDRSDYSKKTGRSKFSSRHAKKSHKNKMKSKFRRDSFTEDFDNPETMFHATFGNKWYTWSFHSWKDSFRDSSTEYDWREQSNWSHRWKKWNGTESESDGESYNVGSTYTVGSSSDRQTLGLPPTGPLKIEDVKNAFRASALRWHPDKHQGPSQAAAEEKFKLCVNAYKSLCSAFSST